ncbi:hypothetical protein ZWY2020_028868 [Hordeum vulgare]|nr:hypothetical protein ZWY2020_028868 [Hordeum vulgare]
MSGHGRYAAGQRPGEAGRPRALRVRGDHNMALLPEAQAGAATAWRGLGLAGPATAWSGRARNCAATTNGRSGCRLLDGERPCVVKTT